MISDEQMLRYSRQIMLPALDIAGQERLLASRVLVVGLGGLGCPVALYLAAAGVGRLALADADSVELSNLQRQVAHTQARLGMNKARSAAAAVAGLNPDCEVECIEALLRPPRLGELAERADLVVDASDNAATRFAVNEACVGAAVPLVSGAAIRSEGQVAVFEPAAGGPCYRCLYSDTAGGEPLACSESGVLAPVVGVIGSLQALEAVKRLAGFGEPLTRHVLLVDMWSLRVRRVRVRRRPGCPVCG